MLTTLLIWLASYTGYFFEISVLVGLLLTTFPRRDPGVARWRIMMVAIAFTLFRAIGEMLKLGLAFPRPCWNPRLVPLIPCPDSFSLPSGHALGAMMLATMAGKLYPKRWVPLTSFSIATLISISRVYVGIHTPVDVGIGALMGIGFGIIMNRVFLK